MAADPRPAAPPTPSLDASLAALAALDARTPTDSAIIVAQDAVIFGVRLDLLAAVAHDNAGDPEGVRACLDKALALIAELRPEAAPVPRAGTVLPFVQRGGRHAR